jgi:hypothetical protein
MTTVKKKANYKTATWITAISAIIVAVIQFYPFRSSSNQKETEMVFSGTVVEQNTNRPIGQAEISVVGVDQHYFSEDNGNFRLQIRSQEIVRIRVCKPGYKVADISYELPSEGNIIVLVQSE